MPGVKYALIMRRYAPNHHKICPHYQAPGNIKNHDKQGIRPYALCVSRFVDMLLVVLPCVLVIYRFSYFAACRRFLDPRERRMQHRSPRRVWQLPIVQLAISRTGKLMGENVGGGDGGGNDGDDGGVNGAYYWTQSPKVNLCC